MYPPLSPWTVDRSWVFNHRGNPREIREVGFWGLLAVSRDKPRIEFSASGLPTKVLNSRGFISRFLSFKLNWSLYVYQLSIHPSILIRFLIPFEANPRVPGLLMTDYQTAELAQVINNPFHNSLLFSSVPGKLAVYKETRICGYMNKKKKHISIKLYYL